MRHTKTRNPSRPSARTSSTPPQSGQAIPVTPVLPASKFGGSPYMPSRVEQEPCARDDAASGPRGSWWNARRALAAWDHERDGADDLRQRVAQCHNPQHTFRGLAARPGVCDGADLGDLAGDDDLLEGALRALGDFPDG